LSSSIRRFSSLAAARLHAGQAGADRPPTILRQSSKDDRGRLHWPAPRRRN